MAKFSGLAASVAVCALLLTSSLHARAQSGPSPLGSFDIGPTKAQVVGVAIGIGAVGAAIGLGVYYGVHHGHSLTGCATSTTIGLELQTDDHQTYALNGEVATITSGNRVRVGGKKSKKNSGATRSFLVEKVSKDFGPCKSSSVALNSKAESDDLRNADKSGHPTVAGDNSVAELSKHE
jgi:hypothetical protein